MDIKKHLILGQPKFGDLSQYNFDTEQDITYVNSISLPKNNDKFQEKDLNTTSYGSDLNNTIINRNLYFSGSSFIKINTLKIDNTGVNYKVKNIKVEVYLFSRTAFMDDTTNTFDVSPLAASYNQLVSILNKSQTEYQIYSETFSRRNKKKGLDNISNLEGVEIVGNMNASIVSYGDLPGSTFNSSSLKLQDTSTGGLIDENTPNALYIAVWMRGDARRWYGTDKRKRRLQVFEINNLELFDNGAGKSTEIVFDNASHTTTGGGGGGGAEAAAFKVTSLHVVINTSEGISAAATTTADAALMTYVLPPLTFTPPPNYTVNITSGSNLYTGKFSSNFLLISPNRQLINTDIYGTSQTDIFPDYFPLTHIRVVENVGGENDSVIQNEDDLQTYHNDIQSINTSVPSTIGFSLQMVIPTDLVNGYPQQDLTSPTNDNPAGNYLYFVIDWDDVDDKFKSIDDYLESKPTTLEELQDKQSNNLYNVRSQTTNGISGLNAPILNNLYITPGIKTIKIIVFSYDNVNNQTGRWKLIKSRFYLNEPLYKYPDFGDVGGSDYTTLPWPHTTPIIGGIDENSKYKKSIQDTLSSGKISNTDIIDEELLIKDLENDEMGKTIRNFDLEQCRYFNTGSYDMNKLLGINPITDDGFKPYNYSVRYNQIKDVFFEDVRHSSYSDKWFGELVSSGNRTGTDLYEQKEYNDGSKGINIRYTATDVTGNTWTFFRYSRLDLYTSLRTFAEGGTHYTFKFDIKFNEWNLYAPRFYLCRLANKYNDWGTAFHNTDGFGMNTAQFYRGDDGIYSDLGLTNKIANYGEWITIQNTRKLISDYSSYQSNSLITADGFPNMEFITDNWENTFDVEEDDAVIDFDIRNPIMAETEIFESINESMLNQKEIYWDGETNSFSEETSVGQIFIGDNPDSDLKQSCKLELNTGELSGKSIYDSSGEGNKGLLIGDYKVKKTRKGEPVRRDSFIKVPKKIGKTRGAL